MRRANPNTKDIFRPKSQLTKEIELANQFTQEVIQVLGERLSNERRERIDAVVSHRTGGLTVAVEGVYDPHNTAAVIRTADAFGLQAVHVIERGHRFLSSRKVTQGSHKWIDLEIWKGVQPFIESVHREGKKVLVAAADARTSLDELDPEEPMALVFGNEHEGVSKEMRQCCDSSFCIPMYGFVESMNISVAAAIAIADLRRGGGGDLTPEQAHVLRARFYLRAVRAGYDIAMLELGKGNR